MAPGKRDGCTRCGGRGWRVVESEDSSSATRCSCWLEAESGRRLERAGVPTGLRHCTLEQFVPGTHQAGVLAENAKLKLARKVAREFIDSWPLTGSTGILFQGPAGAGKTHLAVAIIIELVSRKGAHPLFVDFRDLLKTIQESWNPISQTSEKEVLRRVLDADLLVLDDLGAEKPSPWVRETVAYVINERYNKARPVLITTNLLLSAMPVEQERARDRMQKNLGLRAQASADSLEERVGVPTMSRLIEMCKIVELIDIPDFRRTMKAHGTDVGFGRV